MSLLASLEDSKQLMIECKAWPLRREGYIGSETTKEPVNAGGRVHKWAKIPVILPLTVADTREHLLRVLRPPQA